MLEKLQQIVILLMTNQANIIASDMRAHRALLAIINAQIEDGNDHPEISKAQSLLTAIVDRDEIMAAKIVSLGENLS